MMTALASVSLCIIATAMLVLRGKPRETWKKYGLEWWHTTSLLLPILLLAAGGFGIGLVLADRLWGP
ncbi:MAG: hypothetical protein NT015_01625 [Alphaproteobacteria bacterium]|nr:hypothetical protein [Alphaproteobacteria bacterium]